MTISAIRKVLFAKLETTYGVDALPVAATDAVLCKTLTMSEPLSQKGSERSIVRPFLGNFQQLLAGAFVKLDVEIELAGFGTAGPAAPTPGLDALLQACGLARTITAGVSVAYTPVSAGFASNTLYFYNDGTLHKMLGCRADFTSDWKPGEEPTAKLSVTGVYGGTSDAALPAPNLAAYQTPVVVDSDNTTGIQVMGYAALLNSFSYKLGNTITMRELPGGVKEVLLTDRKSSASVEIEATLVGTKDWWTAIKNGTLGNLALTHGTVAGNIIGFAANQVQFMSPKFNESENIVYMTMEANLLPSNAGNDEFSWTMT